MARPVTVTIVNNVINVSPPDLSMGPAHNQTIQWDIPQNQTGGWTFPATGIAISGNTGQFHGPGVVQQGKRFIWQDNNTDNQTYKYTVSVTNGTSTLTLDPNIINQGETLK